MATGANLEVKITLDDLPEIKAVVQTSIVLHDLQVYGVSNDAEGHTMLSDARNAWNDAVRALKEAQSGDATS